jgi:hypothetical protein
MFNRYKNARIKKSENNDRYFKPTFYPKIDERDSDIMHFVVEGERLDLLSHKYYGDVNLWWIISKANGLDPSIIGLKPAQEIRIPTDVGEIIRSFNSENME